MDGCFARVRSANTSSSFSVCGSPASSAFWCRRFGGVDRRPAFRQRPGACRFRVSRPGIAGRSAGSTTASSPNGCAGSAFAKPSDLAPGDRSSQIYKRRVPGLTGICSAWRARSAPRTERSTRAAVALRRRLSVRGRDTRSNWLSSPDISTAWPFGAAAGFFAAHAALVASLLVAVLLAVVAFGPAAWKLSAGSHLPFCCCAVLPATMTVPERTSRRCRSRSPGRALGTISRAAVPHQAHDLGSARATTITSPPACSASLPF